MARRGGLEPPTPRFVAWCSGPTELPAPTMALIYFRFAQLARPAPLPRSASRRGMQARGPGARHVGRVAARRNRRREGEYSRHLRHAPVWRGDFFRTCSDARLERRTQRCDAVAFAPTAAPYTGHRENFTPLSLDIRAALGGTSGEEGADGFRPGREEWRLLGVGEGRLANAMGALHRVDGRAVLPVPETAPIGREGARNWPSRIDPMCAGFRMSARLERDPRWPRPPVGLIRGYRLEEICEPLQHFDFKGEFLC